MSADTTGNTTDAARIDRLFLIVFVPAIIFIAASIYVRLTSDPDPLWSELALPLFFALLGARSIIRPVPPEARKSTRAVGILLLVLSAALAGLVIYNSQGA